MANEDVATDSVPAFKESLQLDAECAHVISGLLETTEVEKFVNTLESCTGRVLVSGVGKLRFASSSFILNSSISSKLFFLVFPYFSIIVFFLTTGKSGIIAQRMSASLASTGTPSHFIHAAEWTHGDLGMSLTFAR